TVFETAAEQALRRSATPRGRLPAARPILRTGSPAQPRYDPASHFFIFPLIFLPGFGALRLGDFLLVAAALMLLHRPYRLRQRGDCRVGRNLDRLSLFGLGALVFRFLLLFCFQDDLL